MQVRNPKKQKKKKFNAHEVPVLMKSQQLITSILYTQTITAYHHDQAYSLHDSDEL